MRGPFVWRLLLCACILGCARPTHPTFFVSPLVSPLLESLQPSTLFTEPFQQLDPNRWREIEVNGRTMYSIEDMGDKRSLKASSHAGASILLCPFRFNPDVYEWLSWEWRVDRLVDGEALTTKGGSDASARVYVYFDTPGLSWQKRNVDYVWSAHLPVDTLVPSAYSSKTSVILVAENGEQHLGQWRTVRRNIEEDYRRCFGEDPPDVVALGIMTDTDSTGSEALAYYANLSVSRDAPALPHR